MNSGVVFFALWKQAAKVSEGASLLLTHDAFSIDKLIPGMLDPEMIEDTAKILNEAQRDEAQLNLIINNRAGGNAPLIAEKIAARLHSEKQQGLF